MVDVNKRLDDKFRELERLMLERHRRGDIAKVKKAWDFAVLAHTGQMRFSGEEYVLHPLEVSRLLLKWNLDTDSVIAGILHDTIEDGGATRKDLVELFGEDVALLVDGVSKVANIRLRRSTEEQFVENLRKMVLFMARDIRVVLIKLADRLHNMRTLWAVKIDKRPRIARETLEIYAPLAERLGMGIIKGELEDLAFKYLYPEEYEELLLKSRPYYKKTSNQIKKIEKILIKGMNAEGIKAEVHGRKKHLYSLWKKLARKEIDGDFGAIHDIIALRVLVENVSQCYSALGVVHAHFKPVPNIGISDFVAQPKPNGYRSIHTKVFGPGGRIVEIQIRTHEMHEQAEYGVAAHWAYAQAKGEGVSDKMLEGGGVKVDNNKLSWVKQLVDWQNEITDSTEYMKAVRFDALNHRNFVFSPKGDVYDLPAGATPIDYAFAVHTSLPEYVQSVKVNGKIATLNYVLQGGDVVEVIKSKNKKPLNRDWLKFVVTTTARRQINKQLRKEK